MNIYFKYLFLFSGKPTTKLRNLVDWRSSLIQNSTILKHRSLGKTPQRIKWTWTNCLIFCQKRSLTPQHQVQDQSGQCCQFWFFQNRLLNAKNCQNKLPVLVLRNYNLLGTCFLVIRSSVWTGKQKSKFSHLLAGSAQ